VRVSIVTVCLNGKRYLDQAIQSVLSQDYHDLEYVIIDGGSTDGSLDLIRAYAAMDSRVKWFAGPDKGIADAMNKGIRMASGDIVAFLHADDFYPDDTVVGDVTAAYSSAPNRIWLTGGIDHVDTNGELQRKLRVRRYSFNRLLRGNIIFHPATFLAKSVYNQFGLFDENYRYAMDYDLWLRIGAVQAPLLLDRSLACFRVHPESSSVRQIDDAFREELQIRLTYLRGKPLRILLHYMYYLLKKVPNRFSLRAFKVI
jgi:glycosyltransferase involved in cell wall biosynthesis